MNDYSGGHGRHRPMGLRQASVLAVAMAGAALLAAACGGGTAAVTSSPANSPYQKALAYAECMRAHGDPGWPDPDSQGNFVINSPGVLTGYQPADNACKKLAPTQSLPPAQYQQKLDEELKYSACMRAHGIADFPDPNTWGLAVGKTGPGVGSFNASTPQFQTASQDCGPILSQILGGPS
jgi:hypothetical protein